MRSLDNVIAAQGVEITVVGMLIVFAVLIIIAFCIAAIPRLLVLINHIYPECDHHHAHLEDMMEDFPPPPLHDRDIAALGFAWYLASTEVKESAA